MMLSSIKIKILASQLALALLAMLAMGIVGYFLMINHVNISQKEKLQYIANYEVEQIKHYFTENKALIERVTYSKEFEDFHITFRDLVLIRHFAKFNQVFPAISYVNIEGQEEIKVVNGKASEQDLKNYSKDPAFQNSLRGHNKVIISPVEPDLELGEPVIKLMVSKYAYFGDEFIGTLVGTIPLSKISGMLKGKIGESGFICLIDHNGAILSYPQEDKILTKITGKGKKAEKLISDCKTLNAGFCRANILGVDGFIAYLPLKETGWSLLVTLPYQEVMAAPNNLKKVAVGIFIIIFVVSIIVSFSLTSGITGPLLKLVTVVNTIAKGNFSERIEVHSKNEIGNLASAFNAMAENLQKITVSRDESIKEITERKRIEEDLRKTNEDLKSTQNQLIQSGKLAAIGELGAGVAHELNNPLTGILGYAQYLLEKIKRDNFNIDDSKTCVRQIEYIEKEAHRAKNIVQSLLKFSRKSHDKFELLNVNNVIEDTLALVGHQLTMNNINIVKELSPDLKEIIGNGNQLQQVFTNIILNAQQAMSDKGELRIRTRNDDNGIKIEFADTGCGIPEENLSRIFDPFFTTKKDWRGTGLGLSISYGIIHDHNGSIRVQSEAGKGSIFTISLPVKGEDKP